MQKIYIDTNVLLQCRGLKELPWHEITKDDDLTLLISRPIQEEIDHLKQDGNSRRAKRARDATTLIRQLILAESSKVVIKESHPHVELTFSPPFLLNDAPFSFLDLSKADDRLIAEALEYKSRFSDENVAILTHDTQPMLTAKHCGLKFIPVPDTWLLPPESDIKDKKILELERKLKALEQNYPTIEICGYDQESNPLKELSLTIHLYPNLNESQIQELIKIVKNKYPSITKFDSPASPEHPIQKNSLTLNRSLFIGQPHYDPPTEKEIRRYMDESYPNWIAKIGEYFKRLPRKLEISKRQSSLSIVIGNIGNVPAESLLVEFNTSGVLLLPSDEYNENATNSTHIEAFPTPPAPPTGKWTIKRGALDLMTSGLNVHNMYSPIKDIIPSLSPYYPKNRDKNAFYWKDKRPSTPTNRWIFECEEFRHKEKKEVFCITLFIPTENQIEKGVIKCNVSARNLCEPSTYILPIKIYYKEEDSFIAVKEYANL